MEITWPNTMSDFKFWCQRVLPAVYDSSLSYYELLCKVVEYLNKTMQNVNSINENGQSMQAEIEELQRLFEEFKTSGFDDYYAARMEQWIRDNAEKIIKEMMITGLWFGLTSDGYFCAYIPETWDDVTFDTGSVYGRNDYGCLILRTNVNGSGVIDNTYSYETSDIELLRRRLNEVDAALSKHEKTLYTNLDEEV